MKIGQRMCWVASAVVMVLFLGFSAAAAPMDGEPIEFTQPDGTVIHLQVFGDEFYAETRTMEGYSVVFDSVAKAYFYAVLSADGNEFSSSGILVGIGKPPPGIPKRLTINKESKRAKIRAQVDKHERETGMGQRWKAIKEKNRKARKKKTEEELAVEDEGQAAPVSSNQAGSSEALPAPPGAGTTGERVGLTILVEFPDEAGTISRQEVDDYCNKSGYAGFGNDGSIYDYFHTQSDGKLRYYNVVTTYVMAPHPKTYYNNTALSSGICGRLLLNDVLQVLVADGFDFSHCTTDASGRLHAINMFFSGNNSGVWSKGLWPHKFNLFPDVDLGGGIYADQYQTSNMGAFLRIGTFCHETGHLLCGYPDLYDYDGDSRGVGYYSLMASSGYSTHPGAIDGYLRYHSGWVETVAIDTASHYRGSVRVDSGALYQFVNSGNESEYFLVDNRAKIGWENGSYLRDEGLLIMHCDEFGDHNHQEMSAANHFEVSIEQADGLFHLEYDINSGGAGDLFHAGDKTTFDDTTLPNAHWWTNATTDPVSGDASGLEIHDIGISGETMTFIVGSGALTGAPEVGVDRSLLEPTAFLGESPADGKIAIWNKAGGELAYTVSSATPWIGLSSAGGTASNESDMVTVSYSADALGSGLHYGQISIENDNNPADVQTVDVDLSIDAAPMLWASSASIAMTGAVEHLSGSVFLTLDNTGGGALSYSVAGPSWLSVAPMNGTISGEADVLEVAFDGTGLEEGEYMGSLTVSSPEAANAPVVVPLVFTTENLLLIAPESGSYTNMEPVSIEWESSAEIYEYIDIELWRDGKQKVVIADDTSNDGSYEWTVPVALPSASNYTIRVSGEGAPSFKESGLLGVWLYRNSFEDGLDGWINRTDDDFDWTRINGGTPSSGTGPDGASDGTYYIYTEASNPNYPDKTTSVSNRFMLGAFSAPELMFDYHMYGGNMGSLHLDVFDGVAWHMDVWTIAGQQHAAYADPWTTAVVDLSPYTVNESADLQFRGTTDWWDSDMAVDNIRIADYTELILTNNVPASWLIGFGLVADDETALLDSDGDGKPNWFEYAAGTSPADPGSTLWITTPAVAADELVISWSAVYGKSYDIMRSTDSSFSSWSNEVSDIPGIEPLCTHTVSTENAVSGFFRIKVDE